MFVPRDMLVERGHDALWGRFYGRTPVPASVQRRRECHAMTTRKTVTIADSGRHGGQLGAKEVRTKSALYLNGLRQLRHRQPTGHRIERQRLLITLETRPTCRGPLGRGFAACLVGWLGSLRSRHAREGTVSEAGRGRPETFAACGRDNAGRRARWAACVTDAGNDAELDCV